MEPSVAHTPLWIPLAIVGSGFVAAVTLGSLAWFNSKRPAGWENAERPDYIPKVKEDDTPDSPV